VSTIVGYASDGAMYCPDHARPMEQDDHPVYSWDAGPDDYCDTCLREWIDATKPEERKSGAPGHVYLLGEAPTARREE
jgi:hypothetical protein